MEKKYVLIERHLRRIGNCGNLLGRIDKLTNHDNYMLQQIINFEDTYLTQQYQTEEINHLYDQLVTEFKRHTNLEIKLELTDSELDEVTWMVDGVYEYSYDGGHLVEMLEKFEMQESETPE